MTTHKSAALYMDQLYTEEPLMVGDVIELPRLGYWKVADVSGHTDHDIFVRLVRGVDSLTYRYRCGTYREGT